MRLVSKPNIIAILLIFLGANLFFSSVDIYLQFGSIEDLYLHLLPLGSLLIILSGVLSSTVFDELVSDEIEEWRTIIVISLLVAGFILIFTGLNGGLFGPYIP